MICGAYGCIVTVHASPAVVRHLFEAAPAGRPDCIPARLAGKDLVERLSGSER